METKHKQTSSSIHYFVSNSNPATSKGTILFIHPAFANHQAFDEQVDFFSSEYTVITMDLLGHGLSQGFETQDKIHDTHKHINEILEAEGIQSIHLVGVSVGALLAQDFANRHPEKVASLTSLAGYDINNYDASTEKAQRKEQMGVMLKAIFSMRWFGKSMARMSAYTERAQNKFYQMSMQLTRKSLSYMASLGKIMNQSKATHPFPLLIMYGEHDSEVAIGLSKKWFSNQPDSQLIVIKDAGHCANMDNPKVFNKELMSFLKSNAS